jgi:hypothetical protein
MLAGSNKVVFLKTVFFKYVLHTHTHTHTHIFLCSSSNLIPQTKSRATQHFRNLYIQIQLHHWSLLQGECDCYWCRFYRTQCFGTHQNTLLHELLSLHVERTALHPSSHPCAIYICMYVRTYVCRYVSIIYLPIYLRVNILSLVYSCSNSILRLQTRTPGGSVYHRKSVLMNLPGGIFCDSEM